MQKLILIFLCVFAFVACEKNSAPKAKENYSLISLDSKNKVFKKNNERLILGDNAPFLLVFLSTWCDYCLGQAQHIENLNKEFNGKIKIYGIFVDKDEEMESLQKFVRDSMTQFSWFYKGDIDKLLQNYKVQTLPFMLLYNKSGDLVMSYNGLTPEEMMAFDIKKTLEN